MSERWTIWVCPDCGSTNMHAATCGAFPGEPVVHGNRVDVAPASQLEAAALEVERLRTWIEEEAVRCPSFETVARVLRRSRDRFSGTEEAER